MFSKLSKTKKKKTRRSTSFPGPFPWLGGGAGKGRGKGSGNEVARRFQILRFEEFFHGGLVWMVGLFVEIKFLRQSVVGDWAPAIPA